MGAPDMIVNGTAAGGPPIGGIGTTNTIPRWTGASTLGDSIITQSGTNRIGVTGAIWCDAAGGVGGVAFGMTDSASIRQTGTNAIMYFDASTTGGNGQFVWRSGNSLTEHARINSAGNFGIGTASPAVRLAVSNAGADGFELDPVGNFITKYNRSTVAYTEMRFRASAFSWFNPTTQAMTLDANGNVVINSAAIATNATNGFLYVPSCAGTPTGTPTTYTGRVPIVVDTTNHKLYFYSGGSWRDAGP